MGTSVNGCGTETNTNRISLYTACV
jgi:hypothetical protein